MSRGRDWQFQKLNAHLIRAWSLFERVIPIYQVNMVLDMIELEDWISVTQTEQELNRSLVQPIAPHRASCGAGPGYSGLCPLGCANPHRTCSAARSPTTTTLPLQPQPLFPRPARCLLASHHAPIAVSPPLLPHGGCWQPSALSCLSASGPRPALAWPRQACSSLPLSFPPQGPWLEAVSTHGLTSAEQRDGII